MKRSALGTYLNGDRVEFGREQPLPFAREFTISLASSSTTNGDAFAVRGEIRRCDSLRHEAVSSDLQMPGGAMSCMVLQRCDDAPEVFAIVWRYLPLWLVDEDLRGFCVCQVNGALALGRKQSCNWLTPGLEVANGDTVLACREYEQYGGLRQLEE